MNFIVFQIYSLLLLLGTIIKYFLNFDVVNNTDRI